MAAAAQEPKADTRAAFNINTIPYFSPRQNIRGNTISAAGVCNNGFALKGGSRRSFVTATLTTRVLSERSTPVGLGIALNGPSLSRPDMENTHTFVSCGSPSPQKWGFDVQFEWVIVAFDNRKLIPKHIKENLAAAFTKERVGIRPTVRLAPCASSPTNPGGLVLDSGASIHVVGDGRLLTGIQRFSFDKWVVCADGTRLPIVGTGTLQRDDFSIPKVHLVEGLMMNLISVSQLDKDHGLCCCFHSNKCEVILADGTVVGGAILQDDGMYDLRFLEVPAEPQD